MSNSELIQLQQTLKQLADELGQINLLQNKYLEENQQLANQIKEINVRILKKIHTIEQEEKDKAILHQKLLESERQKQLKEITFERSYQVQAQMTHSQYKHTQKSKTSMETNNKGNSPVKQIQLKNIQQPQSKQQSRGGYVPPPLFIEESDSEDENEAELMEKIKKKLQEEGDDD